MEQIRISKSLSGTAFPYGHMSPANREFIEHSVGQTFMAKRAGMNYYELPNGMVVHVYNAFTLPPKHQAPVIDTTVNLCVGEIEALEATFIAQHRQLEEKIDALRKKYVQDVGAAYARINEFSIAPGHENLAGLVAEALFKK